MSRYVGFMGPGRAAQVVVMEGVSCLALDARHDLYNHSPDGFSWGYEGSGPAQLSLAILAHATGSDVLALTYYQDFKRQVVANWRQDAGWMYPREDVLAWVLRQLVTDYGLDRAGARKVTDGEFDLYG